MVMRSAVSSQRRWSEKERENKEGGEERHVAGCGKPREERREPFSVLSFIPIPVGIFLELSFAPAGVKDSNDEKRASRHG